MTTTMGLMFAPEDWRPKIDPAATDIVEVLERSAAALERAYLEAGEAPNPELFARLRAEIRAVLATANLAEVSRQLSASDLARLAAVQDSLEELDDSLAWAADAPEELARLADEACA